VDAADASASACEMVLMFSLKNTDPHYRHRDLLRNLFGIFLKNTGFGSFLFWGK
jgi:hypothetical protein